MQHSLPITRRRALALLVAALGVVACGRAEPEVPARRPWATSTPDTAPARPSPTPTVVPTPTPRPVRPAPNAAPTAEAQASAASVAAGRAPGAFRPIPVPDAQARVIPVFDPPPLPSVRRLPPVRLVIPSLGLDTKIVTLGTKRDKKGDLVWETAAFAAGHHRGTANPGEVGNIVISGHISSPNEGDVFRRLPQLAVDECAILYTAERLYLYRVLEKHVVEPTEVSVMEADDQHTLTLITCVPDGIYSQRLVIFAREV